MKTKTVTRTYNVLEPEDLERAVSEYFGKEIKLSEMEVEIYDRRPVDEDFRLDSETHYKNRNRRVVGIDIRVEGAEAVEEFEISEGVFEEDTVNFVDEEGLGLTEFFDEKEQFIKEEYIFAFDTGLFKSYNRYVSTDD